MDPPNAWMTCDGFVKFKAEALGREPHEGETTHEQLLERVAFKLGLRIQLRPGGPDPLRAPCADVRVFASAGLALEASYREAFGWLMTGAPDAESLALARADRAALAATASGAEKSRSGGRL